jgi:hypothetical protein
VAAGDFDGDGRMDLVAGNWGENTQWEPFRSRPLRLYFADFEGDGIDEMIEAHYEPSMQGYVPLIHPDLALRGMPWLRPRFPTWKSWSESTVEQILGGRAGMARVLEADWLSSAVLLNRGDHFIVVRLPDEAQFAPVFGLGVADFDGDGHEDIFLSQNFFATAPGVSRQDAGRGLLLLGDGQGGLVPVSGLSDDFYNFNAERGQLLGRRTGRIFKLGDRLEVQVAKVDTFKRQVDFGLPQSPALKLSPGFERGGQQKRKPAGFPGQLPQRRNKRN